jgi:hypothetical protein
MDDAFPDRLPLENLFDGQLGEQRGRSAVLGLNGFFKLVNDHIHGFTFHRRLPAPPSAPQVEHL